MSLTKNSLIESSPPRLQLLVRFIKCPKRINIIGSRNSRKNCVITVGVHMNELVLHPIQSVYVFRDLLRSRLKFLLLTLMPRCFAISSAFCQAVTSSTRTSNL